MEIDWSKAPEGFPLWLEGTNEDHRRYSGWYRERGLVYESPDGGQWRGCREGQFFTVHRQPAQDPWTGEGLPPVGGWCEILSVPEPKGAWHKGKILYISKSSCVWCWDEKQIDMCANTFEMEFRPIRTPEQIAAEEREKAIAEMVANYTSIGVLTGWAEYVYDVLGYRKPVKP